MSLSLAPRPRLQVDLYSDHYYPMDAAKLAQDAAVVLAAEKVGIGSHDARVRESPRFGCPPPQVFFAGEFGWTAPAGGLADFLEAAAAAPGLSGAAFWSLFPHWDSNGWEQHNDGCV